MLLGDQYHLHSSSNGNGPGIFWNNRRICLPCSPHVNARKAQRPYPRTTAFYSTTSTKFGKKTPRRISNSRPKPRFCWRLPPAPSLRPTRGKVCHDTTQQSNELSTLRLHRVVMILPRSTMLTTTVTTGPQVRLWNASLFRLLCEFAQVTRMKQDHKATVARDPGRGWKPHSIHIFLGHRSRTVQGITAPLELRTSSI